MAWVKIDDNAPHHRKQLLAGPIACWLWVCGLAYCQKHATDGLIPGEAVPFLGVAQWHKAVPSLLKSGLWIADAPSGYRVHDFLHWNDSAASRKEKANESAERVARFREGRKQAVKRDSNSVTPLPNGNAGNATPLPTPRPQPLPQPQPSSVKNTDEHASVGGGGLVMSSAEYVRKREKNRHVGTRLLVPNILHSELMTKLGGDDPDGVLAAWYAELDAEVEASREPIVDVFKWIRPRFEDWATTKAEALAWADTLRVAAELDAADAAAKAARRG